MTRVDLEWTWGRSNVNPMWMSGRSGGLIWGRIGVDLGRSKVNPGSIWDRCVGGAKLRAKWGRSGSMVDLWCRSGVDLGLIRRGVRLDLGTIWWRIWVDPPGAAAESVVGGSRLLSLSARSWALRLDGAPHVHRVFLQADLRSGELAISVGGWTNAAIVRVPELAADLDARPWHPAVILTGVGQQARLLDFQVASGRAARLRARANSGASLLRPRPHLQRMAMSSPRLGNQQSRKIQDCRQRGSEKV